MGTKRIILADTEETVLSALETKFAFELKDITDQIDIEIISDASFFSQYFATPRKADVVICGEELYSNDLKRHDLGTVFVLSENGSNGKTEELNTNWINKYSTSPSALFSRALKELGGDIANTEKDSIVALVYSANGGAGKTTIALGICEKLANDYKKVLYVNAERINNFQHLLNSSLTIPNSVVSKLLSVNGDAYADVKSIIKSENFDYIPPFSVALSSLGLNFSVYEKIILSAKNSKEYDVIVVDTDSVFDEYKASLITNADKVMLVANKTKSSVFAMNKLISNMSCSDTAKFFFVWNNYDEDARDSTQLEGEKPNFMASASIAHVPANKLNKKEMALRSDLQKTAYLVL